MRNTGNTGESGFASSSWFRQRNRSWWHATAKLRKLALQRAYKNAKNFREFARADMTKARIWRAFVPLEVSGTALKQSDDLALRVDVDRIGRRHLGQAGHGHDLTADRHHEFGAG